MRAVPAFPTHGAKQGVGYCGEFGREGVILGTSVGVVNVLLISEPGSRGLGAPVSPAREKPPVRVDRTYRPSSRLCSK